jgi:hypothetical protein
MGDSVYIINPRSSLRLMEGFFLQFFPIRVIIFGLSFMANKSR